MDSYLSSPASARPCVLEMLTCKLCSKILFKPCTALCGHSFCIKCLQSDIAINRFCPICGKKISANGGSYNVNTKLWNLTQHLFPQEIAARKAIDVSSSAQPYGQLSRGSSSNSIISSMLQVFVPIILGVACGIIFHYTISPRYL